MLKNYVKIAWRNLLKYRGYSLINLFGLSIGIAVCLLLALWIRDELSYDQFHQEANAIYRVEWEGKYGDNSWTTPLVPMPLAGTLVTNFPEVQQSTQVYSGKFTVQKAGEYIREKRVLYVDPQFFDVFSIQALVGSVSEAMEHPNALILTKSTARRYFGSIEDYSQLLGKTIQRNDGEQLKVTAIVADFPRQSHLQFDFLAPLKSLTQLDSRKGRWGFATLLTYFKTTPGADTQALATKLQAYVDQHVTTPADQEQGYYDRFPFESITQIYLAPRLSYLWMFGIIAAFILLLACINFINLTTARAMTRAREVGIRKVLGSKRSQLIQQFFSESTLFVLIALLVGFVFALVALPQFNAFTEKELSFQLLNSGQLWIGLSILVMVIVLLTGVAPAVLLSSFAPVKVLKGKLIGANGKDRLRQGLVIFQFCISAILIISTLVVKDQLHYLQHKELGFNQEQVLVIRNAQGLQDQSRIFMNQLAAKPWVSQVAGVQYLPGDGFDSTIFTPEQPATFKETSLNYSHIDAMAVDALQLEMVQGRSFDLSISTDSTACLINEAAAQRLGWDNPIGKNLSYMRAQESRVIGVVKNFNFASLHEQVEPIVLRLATRTLPNIIVRLNTKNVTDPIKIISEEWASHAPTVPFEFAFLDEEIQQLYESEQRMSSVFSLFTLLAIFIACLGLFGLAAFMAEQRTKEIGIRKVLGASVANIVGLLSKDFILLVILALVFATPIAYYLMDQWLDGFAYRVAIKWWIFLTAAGVALILAFVTVSFQSIRAALVDPTHSIRQE